MLNFNTKCSRKETFKTSFFPLYPDFAMVPTLQTLPTSACPSSCVYAPPPKKKIKKLERWEMFQTAGRLKLLFEKVRKLEPSSSRLCVSPFQFRLPLKHLNAWARQLGARATVSRMLDSSIVVNDGLFVVLLFCRSLSLDLWKERERERRKRERRKTDFVCENYL